MKKIWQGGRSPQLNIVIALLVCLLAVGLSACTSTTVGSTLSAGDYQYPKVHSPDGIGKVYMGREIAQIMGHQGAAWLERPSREREEKPETLIQALMLKPTDVVADIGAGTGYFSFRISRFVPDGKVLAVDVQPEMIAILTHLKQARGITNVDPILGEASDPHIPDASVDLALMVDVYHELAYPKEMLSAIARSLKPGGRVVLAEYRGENPLIPIKALHKMTRSQVRRELETSGFTYANTQEILPQQHLMIFTKAM